MNRRRVVVAADAALCRILRRPLESALYEVIETTCGFAALRMLEEDPLDYAVLDVRTPRLGGCDICRRFRSSRAGAKTIIVLLADHEMMVDRAIQKAVGANDVIAMPFSTQRLLIALRWRSLGIDHPA
ncbi:MAG: response regulator, partial [bacterium]